jgi:hypothetical protein
MQGNISFVKVGFLYSCLKHILLLLPAKYDLHDPSPVVEDESKNNLTQPTFATESDKHCTKLSSRKI